MRTALSQMAAYRRVVAELAGIELAYTPAGEGVEFVVPGDVPQLVQLAAMCAARTMRAGQRHPTPHLVAVWCAATLAALDDGTLDGGPVPWSTRRDAVTAWVQAVLDALVVDGELPRPAEFDLPMDNIRPKGRSIR